VLAGHLDGFLDYFERIGALEQRDGMLRATEKGRSYFHFLAEQTRSLLEAYYATISTLQDLAEPTGARQLEKLAQAQFERAHLIGEIQRREGWNTVTFRNALELLVRRGILETAPGDSRERVYQRGEAWSGLSGLRERLAGALADG
jgi:glycerol-3-phosphate O-acyltransferase